MGLDVDWCGLGFFLPAKKNLDINKNVSYLTYMNELSQNSLHNQLDPTDARLTGNINYTVKRADDRRVEIARQIALGGSNEQIAQRMECTAQTVSNIRNNPLINSIIQTFRGERNEKVSKIVDEIVDVAPAAISLLKKTLSVDVTEDEETGARLSQVPDIKDQISAAKSILGFVPKPEAADDPNQIDEAAIDRIKQQAIKIRSAYNTGAEDAEFKDI